MNADKTWHFTVMGLVAWPLNESEAGVDLFLRKFLHDISIIKVGKEGRLLQPHFHSKTRQLRTQPQNSALYDSRLRPWIAQFLRSR